MKRIYRFEKEAIQELDDIIVEEEPLEITLLYDQPNGKAARRNLTITMRTPGADSDLVAGFLFTEGIIQQYSDIRSIRAMDEPAMPGTSSQRLLVELAATAAEEARKVQPRLYMTSACGVCGKSSLESLYKESIFPALSRANWPVVKWKDIIRLPDMLRQAQAAFQQTGGIHASGLFDVHGNLLLVREDVGRHNAMDKLVGAALQQNLLPLQNYVLLFSGRLGYELVQKARMAGASILCAIGAPTSMALQMAEESDMTVIGFLRNERFNVYCGRERID